ncbi:MAG: DUF998 domain-containing protein [Pseudomonadota bacterium]
MLTIIALACAMATLALHITALLLSPDLSAQDPISLLSHGPGAALQTTGLVLFGLAQLLVAIALSQPGHGRFWLFGRVCLAAAGLSNFYVAFYFGMTPLDTLRGPNANDPLWLTASLVGFAMGFLQLGFKRMSSELTAFNTWCLSLWILLIPATLLVDVLSLGVYERITGALYLAWVCGLAFLWRRTTRSEELMQG